MNKILIDLDKIEEQFLNLMCYMYNNHDAISSHVTVGSYEEYQFRIIVTKDDPEEEYPEARCVWATMVA